MTPPVARAATNPMLYLVAGAIFVPVAAVTYALQHGLSWVSAGAALLASLGVAIPLRGQSAARLAFALMGIYFACITFLVLAEAVSHPTPQWTPY